MFIKIAYATALLVSTAAMAQRCDSIAAASYGGWKHVDSAPRDGTTVEMLQTYGIAPWYGIFKWSKERFALGGGNALVPFTAPEPSWVSANDKATGVEEDDCLFWRPYKEKTEGYVDPTGGAQNSVAYWCTYMHRPYDKKTDSCK